MGAIGFELPEESPAEKGEDVYGLFAVGPDGEVGGGFGARLDVPGP